MRIFGKREDFAIEAMVEKDLTPPSQLWGRMRVWVEGTPLGDIDNPYCALFPACLGFEDMLKNLDKLYDPHLMSLPVEELYMKVDQALYGVRVDGELVDTEPEDGTEEYWKHNFLTNWGEMFDRAGKSYIFKTDDSRLVVIQPAERKSVRQLYCSISQFESAAREFLAWHSEEGRRLGGKDA